MRLVELTCSHCDAHLEIDMDNLTAYCPYCGRRLMIDSDHIEDVWIEKEKTKRSKERVQERMMRNQEFTKRKQMEYEYKEKEKKSDNRNSLILILLPFVVFLICIVLLYRMDSDKNDTHIRNNEIEVTVSSKELEGQDYSVISDALSQIGFSNIELKPVDDLVIGLLSKKNSVMSVSINGDTSFDSGTWFPSDASVVISYHVFKGENK